MWRVAGVLMWLADCSLLQPYSRIDVNAISNLCIVVPKKPAPNLYPVWFDSSKFRESVITYGFSIVRINFLTIRCSICGQAINLQLRICG